MTMVSDSSGQAPILSRLSRAGIRVSSLAQLRETAKPYPEAIPVLVGELAERHDPGTMMEVVRALTVPWAKPTAIGPLLAMFRAIDSRNTTSLRWAVGNALEVLWDDDFYEELVECARDRKFGRDRQMIVLGIGKSRNPNSSAILIDLLSDPDVNGHAVKALRMKFRTKSDEAARQGLERLLADHRRWVQKEAEKALATLDESGRSH